MCCVCVRVVRCDCVMLCVVWCVCVLCGVWCCVLLCDVYLRVLCGLCGVWCMCTRVMMCVL